MVTPFEYRREEINEGQNQNTILLSIMSTSFLRTAGPAKTIPCRAEWILPYPSGIGICVLAD